MFPFLRQHMRLLSIWILLSAAALVAHPWGQVGWVEVLALVGPMILGLDRRLHREIAFALGLPAIALLCVLDPTVEIVPRLIIAWSVFAVGVVLTARTVESQQELESIAGRVAFAPPDARAFIEFQEALEREFGRARRHEGAFALLSVGAHPSATDVAASGPYEADLLRELAENRARLEIHEILTRELHVYSDVVAARDRVLALVPEVQGAAVEKLVERVQEAIQKELAFDVQVGVACFPRDAICVEDLIVAADQNRTHSHLRRLPARSTGREVDEPDDLAREVQS